MNEQFYGPDEGNPLLNRYQPQLILGRGAFGSVFKVIDKFQNLEKAIKIVSKHSNPKVQEMFEKEAQILQKFMHKNIITFFSSFETVNRIYYLFKYIKGVTLKEYIKTIEIQDIKEITFQIIQGLIEIHQKDVIHCDLKPANILVNKNGEQLEVTIIDFGLSVDVSKTKGLAGHPRGTINYMAPEQFQGTMFNRAVDIWALGVIVYSMFTQGQHPFTEAEDNEPTCVEKIKLGKIKWPKQIDAQIKDFISRCLAVDIESRMSAYNCSKHPWIKGKGNGDTLTIKELKANFLQRENIFINLKMLLFLQYLKGIAKLQESKKNKLISQKSLRNQPFGRSSLDEKQLKPALFETQNVERDRVRRDMISTAGSKQLLKQLSFKNQPSSSLLPPLSSTPQKLSHPAYLTRKMNLSRDRNDSRGSSIGSRGSNEHLFQTQLVSRYEQNSKELNSDDRTQDFTPQKQIQDNCFTPKRPIVSSFISRPPIQNKVLKNQSVIGQVINRNKSAQKIEKID